MRAKIFWALVGMNAVLGLMFLMNLMQASQATAQVRRPSEYLMIPGEVAGQASGVVYVLDTTNGGLSAMSYNSANKSIDVMPAQDLNRVFGGGGR